MRHASTDEAARALLAIIGQLLSESRPGRADAPQAGLDSALDRELGIDSLAFVELLLRIENAFDVRLPEHLLGEARTPRDLLRAILAGTPRAAEALDALPRYEPSGAEDTAPLRASTLGEILDWHAQRHPERTHVLFLGDDGEGEGEPITYGELRAQAREIASALAGSGIGAGDAVALMLPTSRDFFRAFMGVVLAGAVPVPIYPPARRSEMAEHVRRQSRILGNCGARMLIAPPEGKAIARLLEGLVPSMRRVATVPELAAQRTACALPARAAGDVALLQYTSGSTGDPKGVVLTHGNLLANIRAMGAAIGASSRDVFVSWLPLYHDMGLIGAWMGALHYAFPLVVMPPTAFVTRPARWLRALHRFRGTISSAPNFAYEICATRVDERDIEGLDLSAWRLAFNGAEPVSADTLERFAGRHARYGLRREALAPVYGLAECAVGLAFPPSGRGPLIDCIDRASLAASGEARVARGDDPRALRLPSCGVPLPGHEIRIVDREGRELGERFEGAIEFRGPSATSGYYRNAQKTRELFHGTWLDTGDLGYIAHGELFVTGRAKDVIIRGGQHVHPYEVEEAIGRIPGVRKGCVAVFGVPDAAAGTEKVVILAETRVAPGEAHDALRATLREATVSLLGAPADDVVLVPAHTVLKTSSGKIRRAASRELYMHGDARIGRFAAWRALAHLGASLVAARLQAAGRSMANAAYVAWVWLAASILGALVLPACLWPGYSGRWRMIHGLARAMVRLTRMPLAVQGMENIPASGAVVIVANHASYLDGPLLFALLERPVRFVAKRELAGNALLRFVLRAAGASFVERFDMERGAQDTRELVARARAGEALVFFPEGTFTRAPGLGPFHMGAFITAAQSGAAVVPVALRGMRSILRDGQWRPRRSAVVVRAVAPRQAQAGDWRSAAQLRDAVRADVLAQCGEPDLAPAA